MSNIFETGIKLVVAGSVVVAGAVVVKNVVENECFKDISDPAAIGACIVKQGIGGAFDDAKEILGIGPSRGNTGKTGDFSLTGQGTWDGSAQVAFQTVYMDMDASGTFVYQGRTGLFGNDFPGVDDSVAYYNCGVDQKTGFLHTPCDKKPTRVLAMPCTRLGKGVNNDDLIKDPQDDTSVESNQMPASERTVEWKIDTNDAGTKIDNITIDAGTIDFCLPHVEQSLANYQQWSNRRVNLGQFGGKEMASYRYMMDYLITVAALSEADPFEGIGEDKVKETIATVSKGSMSENPQQAAMVEKAYEDGKVTVRIADPAIRKKYYSDLFERKKSEFQDGTFFKQQGIDVADMKIGNIVERDTDMSGALPR